MLSKAIRHYLYGINGLPSRATEAGLSRPTRSFEDESATESQNDCQVDEAVRDFLHEIDGSISQIVTGHISLPLWSFKGKNITKADKQHLENLKLPAVRENAEKPSLLLHDLGNFSKDSDMQNYLDNIFMLGHHTSFFNTPGSGKTRLVLEGLCQNWGFYFTCFVDSSKLGSRDVQQSLKTRIPESVRLHGPSSTGSGNYTQALGIHKIVGGIFRRVFLARLIIFSSFAKKMDFGADPQSSLQDYRKRWLILQVMPQLGHAKGLDIFDELASRLSKASDDWVASRSKTYLNLVYALILPEPQRTREKAAIFCVLDEAQSAAKNDDDTTTVGEIVRVWEKQCHGKFIDLFMVVTGTGVFKKRVELAITSAIIKGSMYRNHTITGAFSTPSAQRQYLIKYLPRSLYKSDSGKQLLSRLWYWLHGRYRFTVGYIEELIRNGFRQPHRLLNAYVQFFTEIRISDAVKYVKEEERQPELLKLSQEKLDFSELELENRIYIQHVARNYLMGSGTKNIGKDEAMFIQDALARCMSEHSDQRVCIDEPLVLLAVIHWMNTHEGHSVYRALSQELRVYTTDRQNGFEKYLAFSLDLLFSKEHRLDEIFTFHGEVPTWAGMKAELVSVFCDGTGGINVGKTSFFESVSPSVTLGLDAKGEGQTLSWVRHRDRATFCFPDEGMKADILFVLRFPDDGSRIWVALQSKWCESQIKLPGETVRHAMETVTPSRYFLFKDGSTTPRRSNIRRKILQSLLALPRRRKDAGKYSLLRVVASFPAAAEVQAYVEGDLDEEGHPIATLNMQLVEETTRDISPTGMLEGIEKYYVNSLHSKCQVKRKREQEQSSLSDAKRVKRKRV